MTTDELIRLLNEQAPPALRTLGGEVLAWDEGSRTGTLQFAASDAMCNPDGVVQGGFVCGMLDAAMANALFCCAGDVTPFGTLEIKVSYLRKTHPGVLTARGCVRRFGRSVAFLEAELTDANGELLATASSTAKFNSRPSTE